MSEPPPIALRVLDPRLREWGFPHYGSDLSAGLDLHACLDGPVALAAGAPATLVPAGFCMRIGRPGWCAILAPRSGLGHRGLVLGNTVGVIDADYEGPVMISAWNRNAAEGGATITIAPGDRIAQMLFVEAARPRFHLVESFAPTPQGARGAGGFGSTGVGARQRRPGP